jgi:putative ubiquitin-RnfH superfamily antitoxin RatB of RatAB toxin-antitoxin module
MADAGTVEVVYAEAGRAWRARFPASEGLTAGEVLERLPERAPSWPDAAYTPAAMAVFGREIDRGTLLRGGDRLELLRALPTDPKLARRTRAGSVKPA